MDLSYGMVSLPCQIAIVSHFLEENKNLTSIFIFSASIAPVACSPQPAQPTYTYPRLQVSRPCTTKPVCAK